MAFDQQTLINRRFGRLLSRERKKKNISQEGLAFAIGLSRTSITNIEQGRQPVQLHTLYRLAKELGVEPQDLLPAMPNIRSMVPVGAAEIRSLNVMEADWLRKITRIGPQGDPNADVGSRRNSAKSRHAAARTENRSTARSS